MDLATLLSVVQTIITALELPELRNICSVLRNTSKLDDLQRTVSNVKRVLLDAEAMSDEKLSEQDKGYIEDLRDAIYDADDLLDEFVTLAELKHMKLVKEGPGKLLGKARRFFSSIKEFGVVNRMSEGVEDITKKLDTIADNHKKFKLDSPQPISNKPISDEWKEETDSYVCVEDIIGRNDDKKEIVGILLDPNVRPDVSFLSIVGMGGLGKTTLAKLIYHDERITKEFPKRLWVCVGDHNHNRLNVKATLALILTAITESKHDEMTLDQLQRKVRETLVGEKYLLILDDVWNENPNYWLDLKRILTGDPSGSWVVVTTRSHTTAKIVRRESPYELKGLSDDNSWRLFERLAFEPREGETGPPDHLVEIGKKIVKKCANVPLAIRVAGTLLYGEGEDKWSSFEKNELLKVSPEENSILPILKFSYNQLSFSLKSCFNYCALFPKDYEIEKEKLIRLWMAQGYIVTLEGQSLEEAGEEYFSILLRRCFFQDVEKDEYFETIRFKLHDLMHDVAEQVSKNEIRVVDCITGDLDKKIRHLSVDEDTGTVGSFTQSRVRTLLYLRWEKKGLYVGTLLDKWMNLRALDLSHSGIISLPNQICKLVHLRYLDLSRNQKMKVLPKSLTKLHNLETLMLADCYDLIKLPTDFCKLVKLRCLDIELCNGITHMPADMGKLSCLHKLTMYSVDLGNPGCGNQWEGLQILTKLKGNLTITINLFENATYEKRNSGELNGGYLMNKPHLKGITFSFLHRGGEGGKGYEEALMEDMRPHPKLRRLSLVSYKGEKLPSWARGVNLATSLSNLEKIELSGCDGLQYLPNLGKLHHLRWLTLRELTNLEYMEETGKNNNVVEEGVGDNDDDDDHDDDKEENISKVLPWFSHLSSLDIIECRRLALILTVPNVEKVYLKGVNEKLRVTTFGSNNSSYANACRSQNSLDVGGNISISRSVMTDNVRCVESLLSITKLIIESDNKVERLEEVREMWRNYCWSSLRILKIKWCNNLKSVAKRGLEHLTALEELEISWCPNVTLTQGEWEEGEDIRGVGDDPFCPPFLPTLRSLELNILPKVVNLPQWMQHLTSLHSLKIYKCEALEALPEWMPHLTALEKLEIIHCPNLNLTLTQEEEVEGEDHIRGNDPSFPNFLPNLRSLKLASLPKVVNLPDWMQHLTSLHSLEIWDFKAVESLPDWIPHLTSLTHLAIYSCSEELERRCRKSPPGQDWPYIQHIPNFEII